jgi:hypothetical protein
MLTVKKLKNIIANLPDNTDVLIPGSDHNYLSTHVRVTTALYAKNKKEIIEDYGEELTPEKQYGNRKIVLVIN